MTQIQTLTTLATRPSSGHRGWQLEIYDPLGQERLVTYNSLTNPGLIHEGFSSRRYPNNTCGPGSFMAVPEHLIGGDPRNITQLTYDTGSKVVPVHFGYIAKAPDSRVGKISKYELSSGKELLKNSPIPPDFSWSSLLPVDVAYWIGNLVGAFRHPALKFKYDGFPPTGVTIFAPEVRGTNLYEAIQAILKAAPDIKDNDWGVDPEGYVVVRQATGSYTFEGDDFALKFGDRDGEQICTEATIRIANRVSEGAIVSAGYVPRLISYTHTNPANQIYSAPRFFDLPKKSDDTPILEVLEYIPRDAFASTPSAWTPTGGADVAAVVQDGSLTTYATSNSVTSLYLRSRQNNIESGGRVKARDYVGFEVACDLAAGSYDIYVLVSFQNRVDTTYTVRHTLKFDLSILKGQGKVAARFIAPAAVGDNYNESWTEFFVSSSSSLSGLVKLYEFRALQVNTPLLSQIAQSNIRLPARQVSQITFAHTVLETGEVLGGYLLDEKTPPVKTLNVRGEDGKLIPCEVTEYNDTCTATEGMLTRAETGEPIRLPIVTDINYAIQAALEAYR